MKSLSPGLHTTREGLRIHTPAASVLRFVILVVLLAFPSGTHIWVQNSHPNLSGILKMYCIEQSVLAQRGKQTTQPENTS